MPLFPSSSISLSCFSSLRFMNYALDIRHDISIECQMLFKLFPITKNSMCKLITHFNTWCTRARKLSTLCSRWRRCCCTALVPLIVDAVASVGRTAGDGGNNVVACNDVVVIMMPQVFSVLQQWRTTTTVTAAKLSNLYSFCRVLHSANFIIFVREWHGKNNTKTFLSLALCFCCCLSFCWLNISRPLGRSARRWLAAASAVLDRRVNIYGIYATLYMWIWVSEV